MLPWFVWVISGMSSPPSLMPSESPRCSGCAFRDVFQPVKLRQRDRRRQLVYAVVGRDEGHFTQIAAETVVVLVCNLKAAFNLFLAL